MAAPHSDLLRLIRGDDSMYISRELADSADEHGLAPIIDFTAREQELDGDHTALLHVAVRGLEWAALRTRVDDALTRLVNTAEGLGIEIAIFKGSAIGDRWYPAPGLRPAVDIDVFVAPHHLDRLGELVEALTSSPTSRTAVQTMVAEGRVFEYAASVEGVAVDLHLEPMNFVVPIRQRELMWQHTEPMQLPNGDVVRALDLELSIVQALLHLFRDNFADLLHVYDVLLMVDHKPDWDVIEEFAEEEGLTDLVRFSLGIVCDIAQRPSPLPRDLTPTNRALIALFWPERIRLKGNDSVARSFRRPLLASLLIRGRRRDVAKAMAHMLLPPRYVIDDRFPGCNCPYPIALIRWRLSQRSEIKQAKARSIPNAQFDNGARSAAEAAMAHEAV